MDWNLLLRYVSYGILLGTYGVFAWYGKAPVDVFLALVTSAITALGTVHILNKSGSEGSGSAGARRARTCRDSAPLRGALGFCTRRQPAGLWSPQLNFAE